MHEFDQPSPEAFREAVRDVIRKCIYGVDKNPLAVELCKVALWLEAHNPGEPLNFLDHHIKCGDAIVGLLQKADLRKGIADEAFKRLPADDKDVCAELRKKNAQEKKAGVDFMKAGQVIDHSIVDVLSFSKKIDDMPESTPEQVDEKQKAYTDFKNSHEWYTLKNLADIQVAQFFIPKTPETKDKIITEGQYWLYLTGRQMIGPAVGEAMKVAVEKRFFHWFLEFPEVFELGGFDCLLGNPPFLGWKKLSGAFGNDYLNWLLFHFEKAGAMDIVGYFFRQAYLNLRQNGFQALISTNTIAQGGAREGALEYITQGNGTINFAMRSVRWPGLAAVNVSLIAIRKGLWMGPFVLDGKRVNKITTYLDNSEMVGDPFPLKSNEARSFVGSVVNGMGFVMEPEDAERIITANGKYKNVLFPYLNGENLNTSPEQRHSRWIINFFDWEEEKCRQEYPICFERLERLVKPKRATLNREAYRKYWWRYAEACPKLYHTIAGKERVLIIAQVSKTCAFHFVENKYVFDQKLIVFNIDNDGLFVLLQSSIHNIWAWKYCLTMKSDLTYTPTRISETFPFPNDLPEGINNVGSEYHNLRSRSMGILRIGLTKLYNLFHTQDLTQTIISTVSKQPLSLCESALPSILHLRDLHKQMDLSVLAAYKWSDIDLRHDFYEVDYLPENDRVRYTIHPDARKEVLKRLLKLNHERHEEEVKAGLWDKKKAGAKANQKIKEEPVFVGQVGGQQELPIFVKGETQQVNSFDKELFPHEGREKFVCENFSHIVSFAKGYDFSFYLEALLLLTDHQSREVILDRIGKKDESSKIFNQLKNVLPVDTNSEVRLRQLRKWLVDSNLILIDSNDIVTLGADYIKGSINPKFEKLLPYAIEAAHELTNMRKEVLSAKENEFITFFDSCKAA